MKQFQVRHWRDTKSGGYALKDSRDIYEKVANDGARRLRACILAVIPADVVETAVKEALKAKAKKEDPANDTAPVDDLPEPGTPEYEEMSRQADLEAAAESAI